MLRVWDNYKYFDSFSAGIDFRRQNQTDVSFLPDSEKHILFQITAIWSANEMD